MIPDGGAPNSGSPSQGVGQKDPRKGVLLSLVGRDHRDVEPGGDPAGHGRPDESSVVVVMTGHSPGLPSGRRGLPRQCFDTLRHQASLGIRTPELGAKITHSEHSGRTSGDLWA